MAANKMTAKDKERWHESNGIIHGDAPAWIKRWTELGFIEIYDCAFGNDYYRLTKTGKRAFYGKSMTRELFDEDEESEIREAVMESLTGFGKTLTDLTIEVHDETGEEQETIHSEILKMLIEEEIIIEHKHKLFFKK